jgi:hypothetical protein
MELFITSSAACNVAVLVIDPAKMPSVWPICTPNADPSATSSPVTTETSASRL